MTRAHLHASLSRCDCIRVHAHLLHFSSSPLPCARVCKLGCIHARTLQTTLAPTSRGNGARQNGVAPTYLWHRPIAIRLGVHLCTRLSERRHLPSPPLPLAEENLRVNRISVVCWNSRSRYLLLWSHVYSQVGYAPFTSSKSLMGSWAYLKMSLLFK